MDVKSAIFAASGLIGRSEKNQWNNTIRSFEVWCDSQKMELKIVLTSQSPEDLENFQTAFRTMYPNASFINMDRIVPVWYSPIAKDTTTDNKYQIFDVSLYHGHYSCRLDLPQNNITITQILNTIQLAKSAWLQFVFAPYNFTPYLRSHTNQLNKRMKYVKSKTYRSFIEKLKEQKPHENPETGFDFYNHYKVLERDSAEKMQNFHVVMSVRGLIDNGSNEDNEDSNYNYNQGLTSLKPLNDIKCDYDHLTTYSYNYSKFYNKKSKVAGSPIKIDGTKKNFQRIAVFELRLIPSPRKPLENAINHYFSPNMITGNYGFRETLPFLILNPDEIANLIQLPDPVNTRNIKTTRNISLPSKQANKLGFNIGYFEESKRLEEYGQQVKVVQKQAAVISPVDFSRHIYAVGGTGSGKTSLIREIAKHLEESNRNETFPNSFIYLDPKGDDSLKFIQQCNEQSINNETVHFLDPIKTNFSINPLELPKYKPDERQETVSRYVGYFMEIVKEWYGQQQTFVQMERIFRVLLFYMYQNNDAPTFLDMYDIIINIQDEQEKFLQIMFKALGMPESDAMKQALTSIAGLRPESFTPLLNRVEQFATDPILRKVFCVRHGTVKFEDLIKPNNITIVRISPLDLAHHIQPLAIQAFIIKLWFTIQERAARIEDENARNSVILALDEFQIVSKLQVLPMILSQARSYKLGLLLAHQTTAQIDDSLLEEITGNCGTQLAGRVSGKDASKLSKIWDPRFSNEITQQLAAQEDSLDYQDEGRFRPRTVNPSPVLAPQTLRITD